MFSEKWKKADVEAWYLTNSAKLFVEPLFTEENSATVPIGDIIEIMYITDGVVTKFTTDTIIKGNMQIVFSISKGPSTTPDPTPDPTPATP